MSADTKPKSKRGRSESYPIDKLEKVLESILKVIPIAEVNPNRLEKETGIGRQTWKRKMGGTIEELKSRTQVSTNSSRDDENYVTFPNIIETVETYWNNKKKMVIALRDYDKVIQDFYKDAKAKYETEKENRRLKLEIQKLQQELKLAKSNEEHYKKRYLETSVQSQSPTQRAEKDLKDILDINKNQSNKSKALSRDFIKNHSSLFEE
ncbi:hypothetical protein RJD24_08830 [Bacillaceae bacterium IKA-2]|nr:hypothetical protein RJD24_08830 [Bacillaceae bacterium IKA-2]